LASLRISLPGKINVYPLGNSCYNMLYDSTVKGESL
jgi:hypothetical protein